MKQVFLYPNFTKESTHNIVEEVVRQLAQLELEILCEQEVLAQLPQGAQALCRGLEFRDCLAQCDLITVIGGDGSILRIAPDAARYHKPILGINTGKVGFMSELDAHELGYLSKLVEEEYTMDSRMMLDVSVRRGGGEVYQGTLLNDAVITKWPLIRLIPMGVSVNGTPITSLRGDGIIISTPTGSTAYTLSAGGPIIEPNAHCIAVTPICAHELGAKPFVLSADRVVTIEAGNEENKAFFSADGGAPFQLEPQDVITILRSPLQTKLIRLKNTGFYQLIYQKLSV